MHIWVVEVKDDKDSDWEVYVMRFSRIAARDLSYYLKQWFYKTRVVKYISTKGETCA